MSAGKRLSGTIGQGHQYGFCVMVLSKTSLAAIRLPGYSELPVYFGVWHLGGDKAIMAVAHHYCGQHTSCSKKRYNKDLGANCLDKQGKTCSLLCRNIKQRLSGKSATFF